MIKKRQELLLTLPSFLWLLLFFALPCIMILALAFRPADVHGGVGDGWTLDAVRSLWDAQYARIIWRTFWMAFNTTVICVLLALPVSWCMARVSEKYRNLLLLLVILPFLTNFLIRVFAWRTLLHSEGLLQGILHSLGLIDVNTPLLNTPGAVLTVMVYTQLPFAILPLYAAAEKFDFDLLDAARDLGANAWKALWHVFIPGVKQGLLSASIIVFVSSLGQYVIPQFVGGTRDEMIGNKIAQRAFNDRNMPLACALAGALLVAVLVPVLWMAWRERRGEDRK